MATNLHIEVQRVQTWLFSVPRLRAMVGANALLGEVLRVALPELACSGTDWRLQPAIGGYPAADADDPLSEHDNPARDALAGILSRDGGHFVATFADGAPEFAAAASSLIRRELPGLRFRIRLDGQEFSGNHSASLSCELPVFARCQWTGSGIASTTVHQGDEPAEVTLAVRSRHEAGRRARQGRAADLASLLTAETTLASIERSDDIKHPDDFDSLAAGGYLAVIHADGNGVGAGHSQARDDAERAAFFHRNRVLLRRALVTAINRVCQNAKTVPLDLLMLGGDDILIVCRAPLALPLVVDLAAELERLQEDRGDMFHLTLGVGVVISKPNIPFNRLHQVAENLASSAKRRVRGLPASHRISVVDWAVYTSSWLDDPSEVRRRDWVRGTGDNPRILSARPLPVLGQDLRSLQGLLAGAEQLGAAPRSQIRYLVEQLPCGKNLSELAFEELAPDARRALKDAGLEQLWSPLGPGAPLVTSLLDLSEIAEIGRLGRPTAEETELADS